MACGNAAAGNMSLDIDGLGTVALSAFDTRGTLAVDVFGGGGGATGKASFAPFGFRATQSALTPLLFKQLAEGKHSASARVQVRTSDGTKLLSEWTLSNVFVTSVAIVNGEADPKAKAADFTLPPETSFSLVFTKYCYKVFAADGSTVASQMCWDLAANKGV
jgi:type VI protein secretion system component Hcp